jgi:DNA helicase-2/ATP-dependent DNA helicase PcrA
MLEALGEEGVTRLENIGQLVSNVKTYADMHGSEATLAGYLEEIALISDIDNYDENADRVVMMTLHSAKGLEFPYVYIVGLEEGVFPGEQSRWNEEDVEEERRLCYVGITRAKRELIVSSAASRMLYGQTRRNAASRFLQEIDPALLQTVESPQATRRAGFGFGGGRDNEGFARVGYGGAGHGGAGYLDRDYNRGAGGFAPRGRGRQDTHFPPVAPGSRPTTIAGYTSAGAPRPRNDKVSYAAGDVVEHRVFGKGVVKKVSPVAGDFMVEIAFETAGTKKTMANYAPLTKLTES